MAFFRNNACYVYECLKGNLHILKGIYMHTNEAIFCLVSDLVYVCAPLFIFLSVICFLIFYTVSKMFVIVLKIAPSLLSILLPVTYWFASL